VGKAWVESVGRESVDVKAWESVDTHESGKAWTPTKASHESVDTHKEKGESVDTHYLSHYL
jgi:hypothetical protein